MRFSTSPKSLVGLWRRCPLAGAESRNFGAQIDRRVVPQALRGGGELCLRRTATSELHLCLSLRHQHRRRRGRESPGSLRRDPSNVVVSREYKYLCSDPGQDLIKQDILDRKLNRVVVASCSPHLHEQTFRHALASGDLNPFYLQMVNIREQDSWSPLTSRRPPRRRRTWCGPPPEGWP